MSDARLLKLLARHSVRRGNFVLASGKTSSIYVDARLTTMSPEGMVLIGSSALALFNDEGWDVDAVGGLTLGADPIAYAISHESANTASPIRAFTVRKQAKMHGTGKAIEGPLRPRDRVMVVEDVITTGQSALNAIDVLLRAEIQILGVLAVVDREEEGRERIEAAGYPVRSLTRLSEILPFVPASGSDSD
jgi:orotate phosphoribosyltransferase